MAHRIRTHTIRTEADLAEAVRRIAEYDSFVFDVETHNDHALDHYRNSVSWISLATLGYACTIPMTHPVGELVHPSFKQKQKFYEKDEDGKTKVRTRKVTVPATYTDPPTQLRPSVVFAALRPLFFDPQYTKIGHNLIFDLGSVAKYFGGDIPVLPYFDTFTAAKLIDENHNKQGLKDLCGLHLGLHWENPNAASDVDGTSFSKMATYSLLDAAYNWHLFDHFAPIIESMGLAESFAVEMQVLRVCVDMELTGVTVDLEHLNSLSDEFDAKVREHAKTLFKEAGKVFNPNAATDKAWFLFEHCGHEVVTRTAKTQAPQVTTAIVEKLAEVDPRIEALLNYNQFAKLTSMFVGAIDPESGEREGGLAPFLYEGRVHPNFKPLGARTGRFSCAKPNVQQIPSRSPEGARIREAFVAEPGKLLVVGDYAQVEYRILAHYCSDPTLLEAFENGWDPHAATAAIILDKKIDDVTKEERSAFKNFNFAQIYGAGLRKLAGMAGMSEDQTKRFLKVYEDKFPQVLRWKEHVVKTARQRKPNPYVKTVLGRRRHLPQLLWSDDELRSSAERQAVNSVVQGSAADAMKVGMVRVYEDLKPDWKMLMTVHDELMLSVPEADAPEATEYLKERMESVDLFTVPLEVDAASGTSWAEAK